VDVWNEKPVFIRTIYCGRDDLPKMLWIHGYAASGALYYKVLPFLTRKYQVIFIDTIGMGGSSRPDNFDREKFSPQEAIDYFTGYIEKWR
jgi:pimeloyl-ACP methyl ester carboxylesterase